MGKPDDDTNLDTVEEHHDDDYGNTKYNATPENLPTPMWVIIALVIALIALLILIHKFW